MYKFSELDAVAKLHAYDSYFNSMVAFLIRNYILNKQDFETEQTRNGTMYDEDGNAI